jgi:hypothetical protein
MNTDKWRNSLKQNRVSMEEDSLKQKHYLTGTNVKLKCEADGLTKLKIRMMQRRIFRK